MLPITVEESMSLIQSYQVLPRRTEETPLRVNGLSEQMEFRTNCYDIELTEKSLFMYQYVVETDPVIPLDSTKIWYKLVKDIETRLQKVIGLVSHRGNTLWGNKCLEGESLDLIWTSKYRTRRDPKSISESFFMPKSISDSQFGNSMKTSQVVNSVDASFISQSGSLSFLKQKPFDTSMLEKSIDIPSEFRFSLQSGIQENKIQKSQIQTSKNLSRSTEKKSKVSKEKKQLGQKQSKTKRQKESQRQRKFQKTFDKYDKDFIENETKYRVSIRLTSKLDLKQLMTDETQRGKIIQIINIKIKDKLESLGYLQLGKGRFYEKSRLGMDRLEEVGLQVLRGFRFSLIALAKDKLCFQIDPCTRIMQSQNLLEIIQSMGKHNVGRLKGAIVMSRYGNFKTYKIDSIDYKMSPNSYFFVNDTRKGKQSNQRAPKIKKTYFQYFKQAYGVTITNLKQPLVRIYEKPTKIIKQGAIKEKPKYLFLIPELLSLTGMTEIQRKNNTAMKALTPYTKLTPKARFMETQKLIHQIQASDNSKTRNDFSMITIKQPTVVKGFQLNPVHVTMKSTEIIENGEFSLRKPLLNPARLDDWLLFCSNATKHEKIKDFISCLDKASKQLGIILNNPFMNVISYEEGDKDFRLQKEKWVQNLRKELEKENDLPQVVVVYLQPFEEKFYPQIKRLLINQFGVVSQAVKAQTFEKQIGALSIATGIIVQINQKVGRTVWKIERNHQQFNQHSYQIFSNVKETKKQVSQSVFSILDQSKISNETKKSRKHKHEKKEHKEKKEKKEKKEHKEEKHKKEKKENENIEPKAQKKDKNLQQKIETKKLEEHKLEFQDESRLEVESSRIELNSTDQDSSVVNQSVLEVEKTEKKHKKEKKEKKNKDDKSQKDEKKEKKQKKHKDGKGEKGEKDEKVEKKDKKDKHKKEHSVISPSLAEVLRPTLSYEEIKARQLQRQTNKAFKKAPMINLNLTSTLEIASAGFSSSTNSATGKFTLSFVGTTNKQQSQVYTHCRYGMRRKDFLPDLEYEVIFNHWLKTYYEKSKLTIDGKEHHSMPCILVVYREGLSDGQLRKQVLREVRILKKVIANKVPKSLKYDPEIIYLTVNKHPSTRYFSTASKNAAPGSVIFDHFSSAMNFHLISQHVTQGSSTPTQYRIAYRNRFSLSDGALAQFTYELCYGYYNWAGGVRVPAPLQCAGKLARLVGESVRQNVFKIDKQKAIISQSVFNPITKPNVLDQSLIEKLDTSSISSLGQSTVNNFLAIQSSSFDSSFNFFKNQNIIAEPSLTSFSGIDSKGSAAVKEKPEGKEKDPRKLIDRKDAKRDFQNKNFPFKKYDIQKPERERGQRKKEIVDTFFFL